MRIPSRRAFEAGLELARASVELKLPPTRSRGVAMLGSVHRRGAEDPEVSVDQMREAVRVGGTVARGAARLPWHPTCLRQALAAQRMMRRRGIPARIHLGVTGAQNMQAHAWVTVGGTPVLGARGLERFVPLAAFG